MIGKKSGNYADLDYSGVHQFHDVDDPESEPWGSFEVFQGWDYYSEPESVEADINLNGWYYWACFAGCLPDGDPIGPFDTSAEAYHDAQGF